ncbi:SHOCT domain-containing protein [Halobium salinum]|uniref:SHOCT domain-containing protein n=1 Tax=Halobium salinum TaxID=1364940 RepID=A0ABD5P8Y0_9EURY|nr:SHOCT domain-containing protein [Halobium salinum]
MVTAKQLFTWTAGGLALLTVFVLGMAAAAGNQFSGGRWMPHMWGGWMGMGAWGFGMMFVGLLWMALLVALPVALVYWLLTTREASHPDSAMETLREEYARGEIDEEEFESRRRRLSGQ